jgi:hypothetical protein
VARLGSSLIRHSPVAGVFLLRVMVATTIVSRHPVPDFLESGAALLLLPGVSTRPAAAVVMVIELCMETELCHARPSSHNYGLR